MACAQIKSLRVGVTAGLDGDALLEDPFDRLESLWIGDPEGLSKYADLFDMLEHFVAATDVAWRAVARMPALVRLTAPVTTNLGSDDDDFFSTFLPAAASRLEHLDVDWAWEDEPDGAQERYLQGLAATALPALRSFVYHGRGKGEALDVLHAPWFRGLVELKVSLQQGYCELADARALAAALDGSPNLEKLVLQIPETLFSMFEGASLPSLRRLKIIQTPHLGASPVQFDPFGVLCSLQVPALEAFERKFEDYQDGPLSVPARLADRAAPMLPALSELVLNLVPLDEEVCETIGALIPFLPKFEWKSGNSGDPK